MTHVADYFEDGQRPGYKDVCIQVWNDNVHIADVDLTPVDLMQQIELDPTAPLEQWAAHMGRVIARALEDHFMECVTKVGLHYLADFEMVTQVTPDQK
jgi:hypothetical protein